MTSAQFRLLLLRFALLPLVFLGAFVALISLQVQQITTLRERTAQATTIILQCQHLLNSLMDEETGIRSLRRVIPAMALYFVFYCPCRHLGLQR